MSYTEGPWTAEHCGRSFVINARHDYDVCVVRNIGPEDNAANAMLIASAPDLLEALRAIVSQYDAAPDGPLGKGFTNGPFLAARAAIAKAEGKPS